MRSNRCHNLEGEPLRLQQCNSNRSCWPMLLVVTERYGTKKAVFAIFVKMQHYSEFFSKHNTSRLEFCHHASLRRAPTNTGNSGTLLCFLGSYLLCLQLATVCHFPSAVCAPTFNTESSPARVDKRPVHFLMSLPLLVFYSSTR